VTTATRKKANWVQWKIWTGGTRWAEAGEAGLLFFSFLYFSRLLLFFSLPPNFRKKKGWREGEKFRKIAKHVSNIFEINILSQNNFQTFCKYFGLLVLIKLRKYEKGSLRNHRR
jgi:hypothetical protein